MTNTFAKWVDEPHRTGFWLTLRRPVSEPASNADTAACEPGQGLEPQDFVDTVPATYITAAGGRRAPVKGAEGR